MKRECPLQGYIFGPLREVMLVTANEKLKVVGVNPVEGYNRVCLVRNVPLAANDPGKPRTPPEAA